VDHQEEMIDITEIEAQEVEEDFLDPDPEIEVAIEAATEVDTEEISEMTEDMVVANPQDIEKEVSQEIEKDLMAVYTDPETYQDKEKEDKQLIIQEFSQNQRNQHHLHQKNPEITHTDYHQVHKNFELDIVHTIMRKLHT